MGILIASDKGFNPESGFSVTGDLSDGGAATITGTNFGTKPNGAGPWLYWEFGEGSVANNGRGTFTGSWTTNASILQNTVAPNRSHSLEMVLDGTNKSFNSGLVELATDNTDMYLFERSRIDSDGVDMFATNTAYNLKEKRYSALSGDGFNNIITPATGQINRADGNPRLASENVGEGTHFFNADGSAIRNVFGLRKDEWKTDEWQFHQGDVDVDEGTIKVMRNGVVHTHSPNGGATFVTRTAAAPTLMFRFAYYQHLNIGAAHKAFSDFLYMDDSFCHIIVSEEATWESATASPELFFVREPQIPTAWADTSVSITIREGNHASISGKFLYVIDSAGVAQKIGQFQ